MVLDSILELAISQKLVFEGRTIAMGFRAVIEPGTVVGVSHWR